MKFHFFFLPKPRTLAIGVTDPPTNATIRTSHVSQSVNSLMQITPPMQRNTDADDEDEDDADDEDEEEMGESWMFT